MMTPPPLVSVVIPVHNGESYVAEAVNSVLAQTYPALEVLVIDDGSTDQSVEAVGAVRDSRCRVMSQERSGAAVARNHGVSTSGGALLAFLDADDTWMPDKLTLQTNALSANRELDMVFGHYVTFGDDGVRPAETGPAPGYSLGTMLIRRERFLAAGLLAAEWRVGEFIEWYARAQDAGLRGAMLPDVVMRRRVHSANMTRANHDARADYARVLAAVIARRAQRRPEA